MTWGTPGIHDPMPGHPNSFTGQANFLGSRRTNLRKGEFLLQKEEAVKSDLLLSRRFIPVSRRKHVMPTFLAEAVAEDAYEDRDVRGWPEPTDSGTRNRPCGLAQFIRAIG